MVRKGGCQWSGGGRQKVPTAITAAARTNVQVFAFVWKRVCVLSYGLMVKSQESGVVDQFNIGQRARSECTHTYLDTPSKFLDTALN
jgi:hypothetical protein